MVAFSKIFIGLCESSGKVTNKDFWHLILKCAEAEVAAAHSDRSVDVFVVLIEAGLAAEADTLQEIILKKQGKN